MPPLCKGCGSPVEASAFNAEAPTEPAGETVGAIYRTRRDCKSAANIEFTALLAFFVFCSVEVFIYIFLRKKTKFRTFLNSLRRVENIFPFFYIYIA